MRQTLRHITFFLIAAVFAFAIPQASAQTTGGSPIENTASLRYTSSGGVVDTVRSNTVTITVESIASMTMTKTSSAAAVQAGKGVSFTIIVRNTGTVPLASIVVRDTLPAAFAGISSTAGTVQGSVVLWTVPVLLPGAADSLTIASASVAGQPGTVVVNRAFAFDSTGASASDTAGVTVLPSDSLRATITKTGRTTALSTDSVTYTITARNTGPRLLQSVVLRDTLDAAMAFVSSSDSAGIAGRVVTWTFDSLAVGAERAVTIRVRFTGVTSIRTLQNSVTIFADSLAPVRAIARTQVVPAVSSLQVRKLASTDTVDVGSRLRYVLRVRNTGNTRLSNIVLTDTIPSSFLDEVLTSPRASFANGVVTATIPSLMSATSDSVWVTARVRPGTASGQTIPNTLYARTTELPVPRTSTVGVITRYSPDAGLSFVKSASVDSALVGTQVTFTFVVRNTGSTVLSNVAVADTLPAGMFDRSIIFSGTVNRSNNIVTASFDTLMPGEADSVSFTLRLESDLTSPTVVTNTAYASADQVGGPVGSSVSVLAYEVIALRLTKTASADTVQTGNSFFYTLTVSNPGSRDLSNVSVTDTIPATYITPVSVIANGTLTGNIVTAFFPDLFAEESYDITILVRARSDQPGQPRVVNRAYAVSDQTGAAPVIDSAAVTTVRPGGGQLDTTKLVLSKTVSAGTVLIGTDIRYTLRVRNAGNIRLSNVQVVDTIPAVLTNLRPTAGTLSGRILRWSLNTLDVGASDSVVITGLVTDTITARTTVRNMAYAWSDATPRDTASATFVARVPLPDRSCRIHLAIRPRTVIGNGLAASVIEAFVSDTLGRPKPDGTIVTFRTDIGFFSNGLDSIEVPTVNGYAKDSLRAVISSGAVVRAHALVSVEEPGVCSAQELIEIVFFPGAISGVVLDNVTRQPVEGAVVTVYSSSGELIETFTTGPDGTYLIPVPKTDEYTVVIDTRDRFGESIVVTTTVSVNVPGTGGNPPVPTKNLITGKVYFFVSGRPLVAQRLKVILISEPPSSPGKVIGGHDDGRIAVFGSIDSTITDSTGTYVFKNVQPGLYTVRLSHPSLGGQMPVGSIDPGQMIVDVNIPIVLNTQLGLTKTGPTAALRRDTVSYTISASNTGTFSVDSVVVTDSLDAAMTFISATVTAGSVLPFDPITRTVAWDLGRLDSTGGPLTSASMTVVVRFADTITTDQRVTNHAFLTGRDVSPRLEASAPTDIVNPDLTITKTALKRVLEVGDVATYTVTVTNNMPTFPVMNVTVDDTPPFGFSYAAGSSFRGMTAMPDPAPQKVLTWLLADTLWPGQSVSLTYKLIVGAGALEGNGINRAHAVAYTPTGRALSTDVAVEQVDVRAGLFTDRGLIVGKVFYDENRNAHQDTGETGVKGIEIMLENGTRVITGDEGKFSIPDIEPGEHVLRVRERSLPAGSALIEGFNDFAGDAASRFVYVTPAGIARADFYLFQTTPDTVALSKSVAKVGPVQLTRWTDPMNLVFIEDERRAPMKLTGVNFEVAKADLRQEAAPSLSQLADIMREYPDVTLLIVGHTDTLQIRTRQFPNNMVLSTARANAVKQFLTDREGIDSSRIRTLGLGETRPVAWNRTSEGRALNRRVEFYFNDDFEPKPLTVASILMKIQVTYDGAVPARSISFVDQLDPLLRYVPGSGLLGDSTTIEPDKHNGEIHWTIPNLGRHFSEVLTYRVEIDKPEDKVLTAWTTTRDITVRTDAGEVRSDTTVSTINHVAVALRGRAANFVMSGILFRVGSADLRPAALSALDGAAEYLRNDPTATVVVEGHTDATPMRGGQFTSNVDLSDARAKTVIDILEKTHGIGRSRMRAFGFGALRPVATNETPVGRERNRRVEIRIYTQTFVDRVIQAGRIDSSRAVAAVLMPAPGTDAPIAADTLHAGERFLITLTVSRPVSSKTTGLSVIDSLPSALGLVDGTLTPLEGVASLSGGRVIAAQARPQAATISFSYVVEVRTPMTRDALLRHPYRTVRLERSGEVVVDEYVSNGNGKRISSIE